MAHESFSARVMPFGRYRAARRRRLVRAFVIIIGSNPCAKKNNEPTPAFSDFPIATCAALNASCDILQYYLGVKTVRNVT